MLVKKGNVYILGRHHLFCGDCCDSELVKKYLGNQKINLLLSDPPYAINYVGAKNNFGQISKQKNIAGDQIQTESKYLDFCQKWLDAILPFFDKKNAIYIFNADKMILTIKQAMESKNIKFAQLLIWIKNQPVVGRLDFCPQHELVAYGWFGTHRFYKSKDKSVIIYPKPKKSKLHPTMKPIGLLRRLILNSSKIGDNVWDGFCGSGSTLIACEQTQRNCFAMEIDPEYCQTIIDRFEDLTGVKAILERNLL